MCTDYRMQRMNKSTQAVCSIEYIKTSQAFNAVQNINKGQQSQIQLFSIYMLQLKVTVKKKKLILKADQMIQL